MCMPNNKLCPNALPELPFLFLVLLNDFHTFTRFESILPYHNDLLLSAVKHDQFAMVFRCPGLLSCESQDAIDFSKGHYQSKVEFRDYTP